MTVEAIRKAALAAGQTQERFRFYVFDDGSSDGTLESLRTLDLEIDVLVGDGTAYWARSMAILEQRVLSTNPSNTDYIFWMNDDVQLVLSSFGTLLEILHDHPVAIAVGAFCSPLDPTETTYSGYKLTGRDPLRLSRVDPLRESAKPIDTFNGNFVAMNVATTKRVGGIDGHYSHAFADLDFGLRAEKIHIPILLSGDYVGTCARNVAGHRNLRAEWRTFVGIKGAGHAASLKRYYAKHSGRSWFFLIMGTYARWWLRRLVATRTTPETGPDAPQERFRVLHVMAELHPSGMERMLISAAGHWRSAGVSSSAVLGFGPRHTFSANLRASGYEVYEIGHGKRNALAWLKYWHLVRRLRPSVIHIHAEGSFALTTGLGALAAPEAKIVRTVHNIFPTGGKAGRRRSAQAKFADRFISDFIGPSPDVCANEHGCNGRKLGLIFNWTDDRFHLHARQPDQSRKSRPRCGLIVGNSSPVKNQVLALRALYEAGYDVTLYGSSRMASSQELALLNKFEREGRLRHRGVGDPFESFFECDVYLMPSRHEGMPVALAEAITAGIPALISDAPGMQWAQALRGVEVLPFDEDAWTGSLRAEPTFVMMRGTEPPDFSAARGVAEYARVYGLVSGYGDDV